MFTNNLNSNKNNRSEDESEINREGEILRDDFKTEKFCFLLYIIIYYIYL